MSHIKTPLEIAREGWKKTGRITGLRMYMDKELPKYGHTYSVMEIDTFIMSVNSFCKWSITMQRLLELATTRNLAF